MWYDGVCRMLVAGMVRILWVAGVKKAFGVIRWGYHTWNTQVAIAVEDVIVHRFSLENVRTLYKLVLGLFATLRGGSG